MKIALVHDHLYQAGGAERVLYALKQLYPEAPIYTLIYNKKQIKGFEDFDIRTSFIQKLPLGKSKFKWYLPLMPTAIEELDLSEYDVVISSASALAKGIVTTPNTLHICYCHTPTRYLWSDTHRYRHDIKVNPLVRSLLPLFLNKLRVWDQLAGQRVDTYIANSHFVSQRIKNYYGKDSVVIYPPVDTHNFYISDTTDDYFLMVSRLRPYKKVDLAIQAFNKLGLPLKIVGIGEDEQYLKKMARENIEFLGAVSEEEKRELLARCKAFIHPQEEDFGITAIEAMASGRPVIAYNAGGARETVISGLTGEFIHEQSWEELIDVIIKFDDKKYHPERIKQHAETFGITQFNEQLTSYVDLCVKDFSKHNLSLI